MAENITEPATDLIARAIGDPGSVLPRNEGESVTRWAARAVESVLAPAKCDMRHQPPMDFAWCETHDTTFPLGEKCKFDGREPWEVYAEEADEQRGLKVQAEMRAEEHELAASALVDLSKWIDEGNAHRAPEAITWGRLAKITEEAGEVIEAYIGVTGQNPRKGTTHDVEDVVEELLDVAVTALGAIEHLSDHRGDALAMLQNKILRVRLRATQNQTRPAPAAETPMEPCS